MNDKNNYFFRNIAKMLTFLKIFCLIRTFVKKFRNILALTFNSFAQDNATKLSGSLAYSTIFSLPPMLLLVILSGGYFYGQDAFQGKIFAELKDIIGSNTAMQIQNIIKGLYFQDNSFLATVISITALVIGATSIFTEIQGSLNQIWGVRSKSKKGILKILINRALSFSMIIGLGFLLIISLLANTIILTMGHWILDHFSWLPVGLIDGFNQAFLFLILNFLFAFIYKVLPDIKIKWRQVLPGALLTTLLFLLGKFFIGLYISRNNMISLYGAGSSIIILLVWVYFSALILYLGAEFSKAWTSINGYIIRPSSLAEESEKSLWLNYLRKLKNQE